MSAAVVYSPGYEADLHGHVFPIEKCGLVARVLVEAHMLVPGELIQPEPATRADLALVHTREYLDDLDECRMTPRTYRSEMALDPAITAAFTLQAGGTIRAAREALARRRGADGAPVRGGAAAVSLGGGLHHAYPDHAEGFCYLNDVAVAIRRARADGAAGRVVVVDCDVHQGNGTAVIFREEPEVVTFSIHQENNYPMKEKSDLDVGLADLADDEQYLVELRAALGELDRRGPYDAVFYLAGADPYEHDRLGGLALTRDGLAARDRAVINWARERDLALVVTLAGGYAEDLLDTVAIHARTAAEVIMAYRESAPPVAGG